MLYEHSAALTAKPVLKEHLQKRQSVYSNLILGRPEQWTLDQLVKAGMDWNRHLSEASEESLGLVRSRFIISSHDLAYFLKMTYPIE